MPRETKQGLYQGKIEKDENENYFCGPFLLDYKTAKYYFQIGDKISIKKIVANTSAKSIEKYPQKAIKFTLAGDNWGI